MVPLAFQHAALRLGSLPYTGREAAEALGATHLVVPEAWVKRHATAIE